MLHSFEERGQINKFSDLRVERNCVTKVDVEEVVKLGNKPSPYL